MRPASLTRSARSTSQSLLLLGTVLASRGKRWRHATLVARSEINAWHVERCNMTRFDVFSVFPSHLHKLSQSISRMWIWSDFPSKRFPALFLTTGFRLESFELHEFVCLPPVDKHGGFPPPGVQLLRRFRFCSLLKSSVFRNAKKRTRAKGSVFIALMFSHGCVFSAAFFRSALCWNARWRFCFASCMNFIDALTSWHRNLSFIRSDSIRNEKNEVSAGRNELKFLTANHHPVVAVTVTSQNFSCSGTRRLRLSWCFHNECDGVFIPKMIVFFIPKMMVFSYPRRWYFRFRIDSRERNEMISNETGFSSLFLSKPLLLLSLLSFSKKASFGCKKTRGFCYILDVHVYNTKIRCVFGHFFFFVYFSSFTHIIVVF